MIKFFILQLNGIGFYRSYVYFNILVSTNSKIIQLELHYIGL